MPEPQVATAVEALEPIVLASNMLLLAVLAML